MKYSEDYIIRRRQWYFECWDYIKKAEYRKSNALARKGLKMFPNDTVASFTYYCIMADYALSSKSAKFQEMHEEAVRGMKKLFSKTSNRGISRNFKKQMKNEYYYQTKQFKKQYELGFSYYKRHGDKFDLYSAGVGAANYALQLAKVGEIKVAQKWARKSIDSWDVYFEVDKEYYNPYVHYAMAWGVLGDKAKMMKALKVSSKKCGKPLSYSEFTEVIDEVSRLNFK